MFFIRGTRVRELMEIKKMSLSDLAVALEISSSHCSNILKCRRKVTLKQFNVLSKLFGKDAMYHLVLWDALKMSP